MKNCTVRVELHRADEDEYTRLHSPMESAGFMRWVEGKGGALKRLPTAEYNMADTSRPVPWILVTESAGQQWSGLPPWND